MLVRLEDLENRARAGCLDLGGTLTPAGLRMLACDCAVVPIVLNGAGRPWTWGGPPASSPTDSAGPSRCGSVRGAGRPPGAAPPAVGRGGGVRQGAGPAEEQAVQRWHAGGGVELLLEKGVVPGAEAAA
ncbi:MAG: hypothetical protein ACRDRK_11760 [Pseudonocardia sp.]